MDAGGHALLFQVFGQLVPLGDADGINMADRLGERTDFNRADSDLAQKPVIELAVFPSGKR